MVLGIPRDSFLVTPTSSNCMLSMRGLVFSLEVELLMVYHLTLPVVFVPVVRVDGGG